MFKARNVLVRHQIGVVAEKQQLVTRRFGVTNEQETQLKVPSGVHAVRHSSHTN